MRRKPRARRRSTGTSKLCLVPVKYSSGWRGRRRGRTGAGRRGRGARWRDGPSCCLSSGVDAAELGDAVGGGAAGGRLAAVDEDADLGVGEAGQVVVGDGRPLFEGQALE